MRGAKQPHAELQTPAQLDRDFLREFEQILADPSAGCAFREARSLRLLAAHVDDLILAASPVHNKVEFPFTSLAAGRNVQDASGKRRVGAGVRQRVLVALGDQFVRRVADTSVSYVTAGMSQHQ